MAWLTPYLGPNPTVDAVIGQICALLVGNRTFRGDDPYQGTPRQASRLAGVDRPPVRADPPRPHHDGARSHLRRGLAGGFAAAQAAAGDQYVNILGATVAR
jgi:hypothetical protein